MPFWSPNGESLGFFAESKLKRIDVDTGVIQPLADATLTPSGGSWSKDGTILFSPNLTLGILQVRDTGGAATLVVPDGASPKFLLDGRHFLYRRSEAGIHVGSLGGFEPKHLLDSLIAVPGPPEYLLFILRGTLYIQRWDENGLALRGTPTVLAQRVSIATSGRSASIAASPTGSIAFRDASSANSNLRRLSWFDRSGEETVRVGDLGGHSPTLSPDNAYVAVSRVTDGNDVWLIETARGGATPFTSGRVNQTAVWSPDGLSIAFSSARNGPVEMFVKSLNNGDERPLFEFPNRNARTPTDWAGGYLLYRENSPASFYDIWALPMSGNPREPIPVLKTEHAERDAQFSPDVKWIAYESNKSGRSEIYMTQFPRSRREFPISTNGGAQVRWNPKNQNELFYLTLDGRLTAVTLQFSPDGQAVKALDPVILFQTRIGTVVLGPQKQQYVVSKDGRRFLVSSVIEEALSPITLIFNWSPAK